MADEEEGPSAEDIATARNEGREGTSAGLFHTDSAQEADARAAGEAETAQTEALVRAADAAEEANKDDE